MVSILFAAPPPIPGGLECWGQGEGLSLGPGTRAYYSVKQEQWVLDREVQAAWELESLTAALASWLSFPSPRGGASLGACAQSQCLFQAALHMFLVAAHRSNPWILQELPST